MELILGPTITCRTSRSRLELHPDMFWGMVTSMWIGNAMLVVINLPLIGLWVRLLQVPYRLLFPASC